MSQVRGSGLGEPAPPEGVGMGTGGVEDDWWRAGGGGSGGSEMALMALEVLKPMMPQDLERLSDQVKRCISIIGFCVKEKGRR